MAYREIKRKTRRKFNSEEKIRIILEGLKGEDSIAELKITAFLISIDCSSPWLSLFIVYRSVNF